MYKYIHQGCITTTISMILCDCAPYLIIGNLTFDKVFRVLCRVGAADLGDDPQYAPAQTQE